MSDDAGISPAKVHIRDICPEVGLRIVDFGEFLDQGDNVRK
jgi:hypothetical protein